MSARTERIALRLLESQRTTTNVVRLSLGSERVNVRTTFREDVIKYWTPLSVLQACLNHYPYTVVAGNAFGYDLRRRLNWAIVACGGKSHAPEDDIQKVARRVLNITDWVTWDGADATALKFNPHGMHLLYMFLSEYGYPLSDVVKNPSELPSLVRDFD